MKFSPTVVTADAVSLGASVNSTPFRIEGMNQVAIQATFTGTPAGTFKIQVSVDQGSDEIGTGISTWSDMAGSSSTVSAAGDIFWEINTCAKWVRVVYTRSSSTGTLTIKAFAKGAN